MALDGTHGTAFLLNTHREDEFQRKTGISEGKSPLEPQLSAQHLLNALLCAPLCSQGESRRGLLGYLCPTSSTSPRDFPSLDPLHHMGSHGKQSPAQPLIASGVSLGYFCHSLGVLSPGSPGRGGRTLSHPVPVDPCKCESQGKDTTLINKWGPRRHSRIVYFPIFFKGKKRWGSRSRVCPSPPSNSSRMQQGWRDWGPFQGLQADVKPRMQPQELRWGFPGRMDGKGEKESDREIGRI